MKRFLCVLALLALPAAADPNLREQLEDQHAEGQDHWIYNDLTAGFAKAKETGKPLFVTFRCVPCHACMEFDGLVAGGDARIKELAGKFVAVRQVEMKGVDLSQFQFDYDLNWAAMFLNADGTVYARYGTQSAEGPDAYNSKESLLKTMQRVLELHEEYPSNKTLLEGKRGAKKPYRTALEMPGLPGKDKFRQKTERSNCIHCHNIHDAEVLDAYDKGAFTSEMLWRYPLPENIGLKIDRMEGTVVDAVLPGSPAAKAGLQKGDTIIAMDGQGIASIADMQWVLHHLTNEDESIVLMFKRPGLMKLKSLELPAGWKQTDISWRGSMWSVPPRLRIWLPEPDEKERRKHQLPEGEPAVVARWINTGEEAGRLAKEAGLETGDLIIEVDGKPVPEGGGGKFSTFIKLNYKPGQKLPLTVFRKGKRVQIELPLIR